MNAYEEERRKFRVLASMSPLVPFFYFAAGLLIPRKWVADRPEPSMNFLIAALAAGTAVLLVPRILEGRYLKRRDPAGRRDLKALFRFVFFAGLLGEGLCVAGLVFLLLGFPRILFFAFFFLGVVFFADFRTLRFEAYRAAFEEEETPH